MSAKWTVPGFVFAGEHLLIHAYPQEVPQEHRDRLMDHMEASRRKGFVSWDAALFLERGLLRYCSQHQIALLRGHDPHPEATLAAILAKDARVAKLTKEALTTRLAAPVRTRVMTLAQDAKVIADWVATHLPIVAELARVKNTFTTDDIWPLCLNQPAAPRAMGALMSQAKRLGYIERTTQTVPSIRVECHARPIRIWNSKLFTNCQETR